MIKHTPFYHLHSAAGATFEDRLGFAIPVVFSTVEEEHMAVRERVGMFDVHYQVAIEIKGRNAEKLMERLLVNNIRGKPNGTVLYSSICKEDGGIVDDLTAFKFDEHRYWLFPTPVRVPAVVDFASRQAGQLSLSVTNLGYANAYISVQGPRSREVLAGLTNVSLETADLPYFRFAVGSVGAVPQVVISRTGFSGELGYELIFPVEYAEYVWKEVAAAGQRFGIRPCGLRSLRTLRMEKKYPIYTLELDETTDPISAGLGWTVRFDDREFVGRAALERIKKQGPEKELRLLDMGGFHPVNRGDLVLVGDQQVSTLTSAEPCFALRSTIAFAYLPKSCAAKGSIIHIVAANGDNKARISATVLDQAPYDPKRLRART